MIYPSSTAVEIHHQGAWHAAGELLALADDKAIFSYLPEYVFGDIGLPISLKFPVGFTSEPLREGLLGTEPDRRPPAFLYDLVPQGRGRKFLLSALSLTDHDSTVMPLVMAGAFNPIGCLRLSTAVAFYQREATKNAQPVATGFALNDMRLHAQDFVDHIALHAMLSTGTTGVQGVAPKFLLTTDAQGQWFADMALPDAAAQAHWLVKLPRGHADADRAVLRNEAAYLRVAAACGVRTLQGADHAPFLIGDMLFVRRFDRVVDPTGLHRLHQESLASLVGQQGFGRAQSQQSLLYALRAVTTDPEAETLEFIKRDVLNLALRNTDNHARNTAVQRTVTGEIQLTPVFDFAPMFMDPDIVPRSCWWTDAHGVRQKNWSQVIAQLALPEDERVQLARALCAFSTTIAQLEKVLQDCGVDTDVATACHRSIADQVQQLEQLAQFGG